MLSGISLRLGATVALVAAVAGAWGWHRSVEAERDALRVEAALARDVASRNATAAESLRAEAQRLHAALAEREAHISALAEQSAALQRRLSHARATPAGRLPIQGLFDGVLRVDRIVPHRHRT